MFGHEINWQGLCLVFSDWRVTWIYLLEKFCKFFIFLVPLLLKQEILLVFLGNFFLLVFFGSFFLILCSQFFFKSWLGNETRLKKLREVLNYNKFIYNTFSWDTVNIEIINRAKVQFSVWLKMMEIVNLLLVKCRQGLSNCIKIPHCFVSLSFYV